MAALPPGGALPPAQTATDDRLTALFEDAFYANVRLIVGSMLGGGGDSFGVTLQLGMDAGTSAIPTGLKVPHWIDFAGRVRSWVLIADAASDVTLDVLWGTRDRYPTLMSLCGTAKPAMTVAGNPNGIAWNTTPLVGTWPLVDITAGSIVRFDLQTCTAHQLAIALRIDRTAT